MSIARLQRELAELRARVEQLEAAQEPAPRPRSYPRAALLPRDRQHALSVSARTSARPFGGA